MSILICILILFLTVNQLLQNLLCGEAFFRPDRAVNDLYKTLQLPQC